MSWSSGKDSAYALSQLKQLSHVEIAGILTTITEDYNRVSMHSTRLSLLQEQANRLNLPLHIVTIPARCTNAIYVSRMQAQLTVQAEQGITHIGYGDLFLEEIKQYREAMLASMPLAPLFPLWQKNTCDLAQDMIIQGMKAVVTCIDSRKLPASFAGREFDRNFLNDLPSDIDPCGENGEFHTFVYAGPMFTHPIPIRIGENVEQNNYIFTDVYM